MIISLFCIPLLCLNLASTHTMANALAILAAACLLGIRVLMDEFLVSVTCSSLSSSVVLFSPPFRLVVAPEKLQPPLSSLLVHS